MGEEWAGKVEAATELVKHYKAEVRYVDYDDFDTAWSYVEDRIKRVRAQLMIQRLAGDA